MMTPDQLQALRSNLRNYTACDISDALLKLQVPHAGHLLDLTVITEPPSENLPIVALASTVRFAPKSSSDPALPKHYADTVTANPDHIIMLSQPPNQRCAVLGGLIAKRLYMRGIRNIVVGGRVRDVQELQGNEGLGVWALGRSTVATGAEAKAVEVGGSIDIAGVEVKEGDVVFVGHDGIVVVPVERVGDVLEVLPGIVQADEMVMKALERGWAIGQAVREFRGK